MTEAEIDLLTARKENDAAAHQILDAVLDILAWIDESSLALSTTSELRKGCTKIMEACAWQDIVGQRLAKVASFLSSNGDSADDALPANSLLSGPALPGTGLDQRMADEIFTGAPLEGLDLKA